MRWVCVVFVAGGKRTTEADMKRCSIALSFEPSHYDQNSSARDKQFGGPKLKVDRLCIVDKHSYTYMDQTITHEFGHILGLRHEFHAKEGTLCLTLYKRLLHIEAVQKQQHTRSIDRKVTES